MPALRLTLGDQALTLETLDCHTADIVRLHLPIEGALQVSGGLAWFGSGVVNFLEAGAVEELRPGEVAFRPKDHALVVGLGPAGGPAARLGSRANLWGRVAGWPPAGLEPRSGCAARLEAADPAA